MEIAYDAALVDVEQLASLISRSYHRHGLRAARASR